MTGPDALTPEQEFALLEQATANVAADPELFEQGRALAFAAVDEYRLAHGALELALTDYATLDPALASEAMARVKAHLGTGDFLMQEAGRTVVFGRRDSPEPTPLDGDS